MISINAFEYKRVANVSRILNINVPFISNVWVIKSISKIGKTIDNSSKSRFLNRVYSNIGLIIYSNIKNLSI